MTIEEIKSKVDVFLTDELEIEADKISGDALLKDDLGIDSLEIVDVAVFVEKEFGFKIKPEEFKTIKTYNDFCNTIAERLKA